ncbi:hypothetical protein [Desulfogranum mediterraneum]|uniref:hypothetical protein n=1 Tax=Desulfogranum mediterraneum TaxID=160661 RepID=UPI000491938B|nr:hypothetical protein [Desulfogranum mediterraneum]
MVKRLTVSIPDQLYEKVQNAKKGFSKEFSISKIVQRAIEDNLENALRMTAVYDDGFSFAEEYLGNLNIDEQEKLKKIFRNFPRHYPRDLTSLFSKGGLLSPKNLKKHIDLFQFWKNVHERFEHIEGYGDEDDWNIWIGSPAVHDGVEFYPEKYNTHDELYGNESKPKEEMDLIIEGNRVSVDRNELEKIGRTQVDIRYDNIVNTWQRAIVECVKIFSKKQI